MGRLGGHAVVIGASMGGLLAARAASDFFDKVTLLERDEFPDDDIARKGVPQANHAHGLLSSGRRAIEDFFPGWTDEVVARGGVRSDLANDVGWVGHGVTLRRSPSNLVGLLATRPLLEGAVRRRLLALPNVQALENRSVAGLIANADGTKIDGVTIRIGAGDPQSMAADLVIDATGRGSRSPEWLEALGFPRPEEDHLDVGVGYTTRLYRRKPSDLGGKLGMVVAGSAPNWRNGAVLFQSEDRWIVSFGGYFGDHAPSDNNGLYTAYAASLPTPDIHEIVANAEPLSDFFVYKFPANLRRRYERLTRFPDRYLVVADALCTFNPVYGQGMAVAAQEAALLQACLSEGPINLGKRFFAAAKAAIDIPWDIAVGNDLRHPGVQGKRAPMVRFINWYVGKLHLAATRDPALTAAFLTVANLEKSPDYLMSPAMLMRVLRGNIGA